MPFPSRPAAQRLVRLHRGPKKGRLPIRTLPAFPARFAGATRTTLLIGHILERWTQAFLRVRSRSYRERLATGNGSLRMPNPMSALTTLDTAGSGDVSRAAAIAATVVILALCRLWRNGTCEAWPGLRGLGRRTTRRSHVEKVTSAVWPAEPTVIGLASSEAPALPPRNCCSGHGRFRAREQMAASPGGLAWRSALPDGAE
jgi:hypothetical protein